MEATVNRSALGQLLPLGKGGTALVYRVPQAVVPGAGELVYKEYKQSIRRLAGPGLLNGLLAFVRFRDKLPPTQLRTWDERIVWPVRVVVNDEAAATGILMPLIPPRFFHPFRKRSGAVDHGPRELEKLFGSTDDMGRIGLPPADLATRLAVVAQTAVTYGMMHKAGVVVGDVSGRNLVFDAAPGQSPRVLVVDADSARVQGTRSTFGDQPHTPYWEPPEALLAARQLKYARRPGSGVAPAEVNRLAHRTMVQNRATDVYKFGLLVVRVLDPGRGRAVSKDPARAAAVLRRRVGAEAAELLRLSLGEATGRPTMRDWYDVLHGAPRASRPSSVSVPAAPVAAVAAAALASPAIGDGTVNGNWVFVEGTGWVRRGSRG